MSYFNIYESDEKPKKIINIHGIEIYIEWPCGSVRQYKNSDYKRLMVADYGYVPGAISKYDGDSLDVYVGTVSSDIVYVITQLKVNEEFKGVETRPERTFDEFKYMLDFASEESAKDVYTSTLSEKHFGGIHEISIEEFKLCIKKSRESFKLKETQRFLAGLL